MFGSCSFSCDYRKFVTLITKFHCVTCAVWCGLVWFAGRWTDGEVSILTFSEGKKNAVAFGVVSCSFPRKS
jgi:hypothetical protein